MKKIISGAVALVEKLARLNASEPVVVRGGLVAILNALVVSGIISVSVSSTVSTVVLATLTLALLASTRQSVLPTFVADLNQIDAYVRGHSHAHEFAKLAEQKVAATPTASTFPPDPAAPKPDTK